MTTTPFRPPMKQLLQTSCLICHSRPPWFGATLESQAVKCSAKLEVVKKMFESLSRNVDGVYGECDIDSSVGKVEDVMRELPSIERLVRISTEQQMMEGEGLGS